MNGWNEETSFAHERVVHWNQSWRRISTRLMLLVLASGVCITGLAACTTQGTTENPVAGGSAGVGTPPPSLSVAGSGAQGSGAAGVSGQSTGMSVGAAGVVAAAGSGAAGSTSSAGAS